MTPFLAAAQRQGATVRNGLGMLVYQAARQIRLWTGAEPPLEVMWAVSVEARTAAAEAATELARLASEDDREMRPE